jgi:type II secretory pathway pseudopilin PulG
MGAVLGILAFGAAAGIGSGIQSATKQKEKCESANDLAKQMEQFQETSLKEEEYINKEFDIYKNEINSINENIATNLQALTVMRLQQADTLTQRQIQLTTISVFVFIILILQKRDLLTRNVLILISFAILFTKALIKAIFQNKEYDKIIEERTAVDNSGDSSTDKIDYNNDIYLQSAIKLKDNIGKDLTMSFIGVLSSIVVFMLLYYLVGHKDASNLVVTGILSLALLFQFVMNHALQKQDPLQ